MQARPSRAVCWAGTPGCATLSIGLARAFGALRQASLQGCIGIVAPVAAVLEFGTEVELIEVARVSIGLASQFDFRLRATILRGWSLWFL